MHIKYDIVSVVKFLYQRYSNLFIKAQALLEHILLFNTLCIAMLVCRYGPMLFLCIPGFGSVHPFTSPWTDV